jgi:replication factor C small subunit
MNIINKYIPKTINDFIGNQEIIKELNYEKNILIYGNYGSGKTLLKNLILEKINPQNILHLNINSLKKNNIKKHKLYMFLRKPIKNYIIIDNYDDITIEQQYILKSLIKNYNSHSIIYMFVNNNTNIIENLLNFFTIYKLKDNTREEYYNYIKKISNNENFNFSDKIINYIVDISSNFREINNNLLILLLYKDFENISIENILNIPPKDYTYKILKSCNEKDIYKSIEIINKLLEEGYCINDIFNNFVNYIHKYDMDYEKKIKYIKILLQYQIKINNNLNTYTQLISLISDFISI